MTSFSEKMLIFTRCLHGLMLNLIKKSVTVSSCYVYLLWHHLTSVIKRSQLKRGPILCIYLFFASSCLLKFYQDMTYVTSLQSVFFLLSMLKEIVEWVVYTRKSVLCRYSPQIQTDSISTLPKLCWLFIKSLNELIQQIINYSMNRIG